MFTMIPLLRINWYVYFINMLRHVLLHSLILILNKYLVELIGQRCFKYLAV